MNNQEIIKMCRDYMQLNMITDLDIAEALLYSKSRYTSGFIMRQDPKVVTSFFSVPGADLNPILIRIYAGTPDKFSYKMFIEFSDSDGTIECIEIVHFDDQEEITHTTEINISDGTIIYKSDIQNWDLSAKNYKVVANIDKSDRTWRIVDRV